MENNAIIEMIRSILERQGKAVDALNEQAALREIQFRSLDFSELCLRVEEQLGLELNFDAALLRRVETVADVCEFIRSASVDA